MRSRRSSATPRSLCVAVLVGVTTAGGLAGCGGDASPEPGLAAGTATSPRTTTTDRPSATTGTGADAPTRAATRRPPARWTARCPTRTKSPLGCRGVRARVLSIQSVDPDGDGDLHVVAVGGSVTGPGLTVFDVRPALRPKRDPRPGEWVTGAGPVFRGSYRQRQIQVDVFRVWRPRG
ncbi:hypothetical protein [Patulibacter americanus]|uniref:hypothetical protein n=1 Tax=Patulibacter americanus TaxID=588672 RepID=UPI0003B39543|nr:hypothetical protein [Patulibacter americanus]